MPDRFDEFWAAYPRRKEKKEARKAYSKAVKDGASEADIVAGAWAYRRRCIGVEPKFIKHPTTWLNRGCWDDEDDKVVKPPEDLVWKNRASLAKSPWGRHHVAQDDVEECYRRNLLTKEERDEALR